MAVETVAVSELYTWLQNQPNNTADTPYEIEITGITKTNTDTMRTALVNNIWKYVDLSSTELPSDLTDGTSLFERCQNLVVAPNLPEGILSLRYAFYNCSSLVSAPTIPSTVTDLYATFGHCINLTTPPRVIPNSVTNMTETFLDCEKIISSQDTLPSGITSLTRTFAECSSLIFPPRIPNSVTSLVETFRDCTTLSMSPIIPDNVTNMEKTFKGCTNLGYLPEIPYNVINLVQTFMDCKNVLYLVTTFNRQADVTDIYEGVSGESDIFALTEEQILLYNDMIGDLKVKELKVNELQNHYYLNGDVYICSISSFGNNLSTLPVNRTTTPYRFCVNSLTSSNYEDITTALQQNSTKYVDLRYTTLPSVTNISSLFRGCSSLVYSPTIPSGVTNMGYCFYDCTNLAECPVLPNSVTNLDYAFNVCRAITTPPEIPSGVTSMSRTFGSCSKLVSAPQIPQGVTSLRMTFIYCSSLETVSSFPSNLTSLEYTFSGCYNLSTIPAIPEGVTNMEEAFSDTGLTTVPYVPSTVTNGIRAFAYCESLAKIDEFKISASTLDSSNFQDMFAGCSSLVQIGHKSDLSDSWHVMSLNISSNTVSGKIYDSEGNDTEINEGTAVSITKDTLSLPNLTDEILFPPSSLSDADLEDTILDVIENKYTYWKKTALDPTKKSFVMYADDPDNFVTNIPMGGNSFNICYPIGCTYTQYPMQKSPMQLWGTISTWEVINYGGAFFRAEGGNAMTFDANIKAITAVSGSTITIANHGASVGTVILDYAEDSAGHIIRNESRVVTSVSGNVLTLNSQFTSTNLRNVLIGQNQATAKNGLSIENYSHRHTANMYYGGATNSDGSDYWNNGTQYNHETSYKRQTRTSQNTHNHTLTSTDTETRPSDLTKKIWVRTA